MYQTLDWTLSWQRYKKEKAASKSGTNSYPKFQHFRGKYASPYRSTNMLQLTHSLFRLLEDHTLLWLFHWFHFWSPYWYTEIKGRIWRPNLHMNTPQYLQFHAVLCNLLLNHHVNIITVNIFVVGVSTVLPNRAAHNGECCMKSSIQTLLCLGR